MRFSSWIQTISSISMFGVIDLGRRFGFLKSSIIGLRQRFLFQNLVLLVIITGLRLTLEILIFNQVYTF